METRKVERDHEKSTLERGLVEHRCNVEGNGSRVAFVCVGEKVGNTEGEKGRTDKEH